MKLNWTGRLLRLTALVVLCLGLTGCAVRFVYNQLDWLIPWYLDDYVDLDRHQEELFDERLQVYLDWHRRDQLPQYASFLNGVADRAERGLTRDDLEAIEQDTERFGQALLDHLLRDLMDLLATLDDDQVEQMFRRIEEDNDDFREEYLEPSAEDQRASRYKDVVKYVQRWTGKLSDEQVKLIRERVYQFELMGPELMEGRLVWQQEFRRVLGLRANSSAYESAFIALASNPELGQSEEFTRKLEHNRELAVELYLALERSLSSRQRNRMLDKLRKYAEDFTYLSTQK